MRIVSYISLAILIQNVIVPISTSQVMQSYVWPMGLKSSVPHPEFGGVLLDFRPNEMSLNRFDIQCRLMGHTMLSNPLGELQLYTDGCNVYNGVHEIIDNGDSIVIININSMNIIAKIYL